MTPAASGAEAGWLQPPAHRHLRSRKITALRIPGGIVWAYPRWLP
jgi:hypothetical protein